MNLAKSNFFSIKYRLMLAFGLLIAFVITILILLSLNYANKAVMDRVEKHLISQAQSTAKIIERSVQSDFKHLESVARSPFLKDNKLSYKEKADMLKKEAEASGLTSIYICDNKGMMYLVNGDTVKVSDREYYQKSIKGESHITEPFETRFGDFVISITVPIYDDNKKIVGIIVGTFDGFAFCKYTEGIVVGETGYTYVISRDGYIVAINERKYVKDRWNSIKKAEADSYFTELAEMEKKALKPDAFGIAGYNFGEEGRIIAGYANISSIGWAVIVRAPQGEFLDTIKQLRLMIIIFGLIILAISLFMGYIVSGRITNPIIKVSKTLKTISEGNLINNFDQVKTKDEIGILSNSLINMAEKLREIVIGLNQNSENLTNASNQINYTSQKISQGANDQAASTEEISSTMEEIASNIQQNTDNAKATESLSQTAKDRTLQVSDDARQVVEAINLINEKIGIINGIAFQTNILALNAAVEAARAGEHGKGFAVVASEVRKLAEHSKVAADEIVSLSQNSKKLSDKAGKSLSSVIPQIEKTANLIQGISSASIEQNAGAEQVNSAIQRLNQVAQQNAAASEEMATTSEEMTAQAEQLKEAISYFKLD